MVWRMLFNLFAPPAPAARPSNVPASPAWSPFEPTIELPDTTLQAVLVQTGLCRGDATDLAFVRAAVGGNRAAKGIDLRRRGTALTSAELKEMGLRGTAVLTREYLAILTPLGRASPIEAAQMLVSAVQGELAGANSQGRQLHAGIRLVEVIPNNMAAGPCPACLALAERPIPALEAPTRPLPDCPHPTQCLIRTRAVMTWDEPL